MAVVEGKNAAAHVKNLMVSVPHAPHISLVVTIVITRGTRNAIVIAMSVAMFVVIGCVHH